MKEIDDAEKTIRLYAILETEKDIQSLKRKGKIKKGTEIQDAYYEGLVKGLMMKLPSNNK